MSSVSDDIANNISNSLTMGIEVEKDDPSMKEFIPNLTDKQIIWIGTWLAGEGFK